MHRPSRRIAGIAITDGGRLLGAVEEGIDPCETGEGVRAGEELSRGVGGLQAAV